MAVVKGKKEEDTQKPVVVVEVGQKITDVLGDDIEIKLGESLGTRPNLFDRFRGLIDIVTR
ncbi:MAG: hypothetical protein WC069_01690 [Candidatus Shapirobacteria bacterium]